MLLQPFLAEPVVDPSRLLISKSFVRRVDLGEPLGRRGLLLLAARDLVRVVLEGQLAVGALDLAVVGPSLLSLPFLLCCDVSSSPHLL